MAITVGDYVVATKDIKDIRERSVGLVGDISGKKDYCLFYRSKQDGRNRH